MNAMIVVNPTAGEGVPSPEDVAARCRAAGANVRLEVTTAAGDAIARVASAACAASPPEVVVAVGGDGTVREVAEGLARGLGRWPGGAGVGAERARVGAGGADAGGGNAGAGAAGAGGGAPAPAALLAIPAGSGNSAYHAVWGGRDWRETVAAAFDSTAHRVRALDLIRLVELDRGTVLGVNAGLVAAIASQIERDKDGHRGRRSADAEAADASGASDDERYWSALARALAEFKPARLRIAVDGRVVHEGGAMLVTVGGVRCFGRGSFTLLPRSVLDDALLDVCVTAQVTSERLSELAALVPAGAHVGQPEVTYERGRVVRIERLDDGGLGNGDLGDGGPGGRRPDDRGLQIEHDGDPLRAPRSLTLEVLPGAVPTIAPNESPGTAEESLWSS
jgi:diacylglycerol kinase (ATP)